MSDAMSRPPNRHPKGCECRLCEWESAVRRAKECERSLGAVSRGSAMQMDNNGFFWVGENGVVDGRALCRPLAAIGIC